jgi:hypothetical protein
MLLSQRHQRFNFVASRPEGLLVRAATVGLGDRPRWMSGVGNTRSLSGHRLRIYRTSTTFGAPRRGLVA